MKVAIVHDWFTEKGGAEKVVASILNLYPDAEFFSLVDFFDDKERQSVMQGKKSTYTFIQRLPFAKTYFRFYLWLFPLAIERLDLREFDLIISSSYAVAKGVITGPNQLHISYCHSPMRYAWDMYFPYMKEHNIKGIKEKFLSYILYKIRIWDVVSSNRVDHFIANSSFVQKRIFKYYRRKSKVCCPPVNVSNYTLCQNKKEYYFTASRLVPYKKVKLIVESFVKNGKPLVVAGEGPQLADIKHIATDNITVLGYVDDNKMLKLMQEAKAFMFAAYEDFGIIPVEAMACGTPVIAYGKGGIRDTVIEAVTGTFFDKQNTESINEAIERFETISFDHAAISRHALSFSVERFEEEIKMFIDEKWNEFVKSRE